MKQSTTNLNQKLASSTTQVVGYSIQPTVVSTPRPIYEAFMVLIGRMPPVVDMTIHTTSNVTFDQQLVPAMPVNTFGANFETGVPEIRTDASGVYGGVK